MTAVIGVGESAYSRRSGVSPQRLAMTAGHAAISDAGLKPSDIDGVIPLGGALHAEDIIAALGLPLQTFDATPPPGGNSSVNALRLAETLIESGRLRNVLLLLSRNGASESRIDRRVTSLNGPQFRSELEHPQGWSTPAQWYAMICRRHMLDFGTTKQQLAAVALTMYEHAQSNPRAMRYGRPLTEEAYFASPMIADPYQLFDCCQETDGAAAVIVAADGTPSRGRAVRLLAVESGRPQSPDDLTNRHDWYEIGLSYAAPRAFERASLSPADMDAAMIYDCFTFEVVHQLEAAGFCPLGEGGRFVASGAIRRDGVLPVNTHGGLLAEGHLSGLNHVIEAVRQLRGEAEGRQLPRARHIAVTGWGDWGDGSLAILGGRS